jgi:iron complex transport system ATP-binding protein
MTPLPGTPHALRVEEVSYRAGERDILQRISLEVASGELVAVVGRNGSGKSTLLQVMAGLLPATLGSVMLDGCPMARLSRRALARQIALLPQQARIDFGLVVHDVVRMGRHPHLRRFRPPAPRDEALVYQAMEVTETLPLAQRLITEVSGGERQLILLAQALAQEPRFLLLDEPTANLDIAHQCHIIELLRRLAGEGIGVVAVIHDLSVAIRSFRRLILLDDGGVVGDGLPTDVLNVETIGRIFRVQARFSQDHMDGTPLLWFSL